MKLHSAEAGAQRTLCGHRFRGTVREGDEAAVVIFDYEHRNNLHTVVTTVFGQTTCANCKARERDF
jgi:N-acyl-D-aspartate/D-glutamate deacylase